MADQKRENPPGREAAGFLDSSLLGGLDGQGIAQPQAPGQAAHRDNSVVAATAPRVELVATRNGADAGSAYFSSTEEFSTGHDRRAAATAYDPRAAFEWVYTG